MFAFIKLLIFAPLFNTPKKACLKAGSNLRFSWSIALVIMEMIWVRLFFNLHIICKSPTEFCTPICAFMELRSNANLACLVNLGLSRIVDCRVQTFSCDGKRCSSSLSSSILLSYIPGLIYVNISGWKCWSRISFCFPSWWIILDQHFKVLSWDFVHMGSLCLNASHLPVL